jgi:type I restriction enzyme S subunit
MSKVVPDGWEVKRLSELSSFSGGSAFKEKYQGQTTGDYPFIKVSDMNHPGNRKFINVSNNWIDSSIQKKAKIKLFPKNSIVFAKVGAALLLNKRRILVRETAIDNNMMAAVSTKTDFLFLYYLLQSIDFSDFVQEGAVPSVNQGQMDEIHVISPPIYEQQKIASILTSVDEVIEKTQSQINKLQDLKKGTMNELLTRGIGHTEFKDSPVGRIPKGWEVQKVEKFLKQRKKKGKGGIPIYSVLMKGGMVNRQTVDRRIPSALEESENLFAEKGDLVYNMMRMWQGASGIAPEDCLVSPAYVVCRTLNIYPDFVGFLMKSRESIRKLHGHSQGITGDRLRLYFEHFCEIPFAIPPLQEQQEIASILSSIDNNIEENQQKLQQTQSLKKSLMQDLLTGNVRVTVH